VRSRPRRTGIPLEHSSRASPESRSDHVVPPARIARRSQQALRELPA
jgi:hypothetical protein